MPKIIFQIDLKQDAWNWVRVVQAGRHPFGGDFKKAARNIPAELLKELKKLPPEAARKLAYSQLKKNSKIFLLNLEANKKMLEFYFSRQGDKLFQVLARVTGQPIYTEKFWATFTTMYSCPYNPEKDWFMVSANAPLARQVATACHEILHLQLIHYYLDYCLAQGLNKKQFEDLKESLTFLLNEPVFKNFYLAYDSGYPNHVRQRRQLQRVWEKEKNFLKLLNAGIKIFKNKK